MSGSAPEPKLLPRPKRAVWRGGALPLPKSAPDAEIDPPAFESGGAYRLSACAGEGIKIAAASPRAARYALSTLSQICALSDGGDIPAFDIEDAPDIAVRAFSLDISDGGFPNAENLAAFAEFLSLLKFDELRLGLNAADGERVAALLSKCEAAAIDSLRDSIGIEVLFDVGGEIKSAREFAETAGLSSAAAKSRGEGECFVKVRAGAFSGLESAREAVEKKIGSRAFVAEFSLHAAAPFCAVYPYAAFFAAASWGEAPTDEEACEFLDRLVFREESGDFSRALLALLGVQNAELLCEIFSSPEVRARELVKNAGDVDFSVAENSADFALALAAGAKPRSWDAETLLLEFASSGAALKNAARIAAAGGERSEELAAEQNFIMENLARAQTRRYRDCPIFRKAIYES